MSIVEPGQRGPRPRVSAVSEYHELARRVQAEGLQRRSYGYYWSYFGVATVAFAASWVGVVMLRHSALVGHGTGIHGLLPR